jgi:hypothetical protein
MEFSPAEKKLKAVGCAVATGSHAWLRGLRGAQFKGVGNCNYPMRASVIKLQI